MDVSALEIGKAIHIGEIVAPAGVEILGDKHISVLAVKAPVTEAQEAAADAAGSGGEVQMIGRRRRKTAKRARLPVATRVRPRRTRRSLLKRRSNFNWAEVGLACPAWRTSISLWGWAIRGVLV